MKARPQGARVVPTVATATRTRLAVQRHARDHEPLRRLAPVGVGEDAGDDVGDEDGAQRQQNVLDVVEDPRRTSSETPTAAIGTLT